MGAIHEETANRSPIPGGDKGAAQQAAFQKEEYDRLKSIADKVGIKPQ